jgi:hypothetical protein
MHKYYLSDTENRDFILSNYIPFYAEIEAITHNKESIFHQLKESKTTTYYEKLWQEICTRMQWQGMFTSKALVVDIKDDQGKKPSAVVNFCNPDEFAKIANG